MSKVATLTEPWAPREREKERNAPTFSGTGPAGVTLAGAQSSRSIKPKAIPKAVPKTDQETQRLHVHGDSVKCSIVSGHVTNNGEILFKGKSKSSAPQQPKVVHNNVGPETNAAVTVDGALKQCMVAGSLSTNGITFAEDDDDDD